VTDREHLLDELARVYARAAVDALLAQPEYKNADESSQEQRRRKDRKHAENSSSAPHHTT
jgi:hypothetical protein